VQSELSEEIPSFLYNRMRNSLHMCIDPCSLGNALLEVALLIKLVLQKRGVKIMQNNSGRPGGICRSIKQGGG